MLKFEDLAHQRVTIVLQSQNSSWKDLDIATADHVQADTWTLIVRAPFPF